MIPTPGHTKGHAVFLYRDTFLFTGDHLAWSETRGHLYAFRSACWYSWPEQIKSIEAPPRLPLRVGPPRPRPPHPTPSRRDAREPRAVRDVDVEQVLSAESERWFLGLTT